MTGFLSECSKSGHGISTHDLCIASPTFSQLSYPFLFFFSFLLFHLLCNFHTTDDAREVFTVPSPCWLHSSFLQARLFPSHGGCHEPPILCQILLQTWTPYTILTFIRHLHHRHPVCRHYFYL